MPATRTDIAITDPLYAPERAAEYLDLTPRFLEARRQRGGGPRYVRVSARCIRYRRSDLDAWAAERLQTSTAADAAA